VSPRADLETNDYAFAVLRLSPVTNVHCAVSETLRDQSMDSEGYSCESSHHSFPQVVRAFDRLWELLHGKRFVPDRGRVLAGVSEGVLDI